MGEGKTAPLGRQLNGGIGWGWHVLQRKGEGGLVGHFEARHGVNNPLRTAPAS